MIIAKVVLFSLAEVFLWGIATTLSFITAIQYFLMARKKENENERLINFSYFSIILTLSFWPILNILSYVLIPGEWEGLFYVSSFEKVSIAYKILIRILYSTFFLGFTYFFYVFEKLRRSKKPWMSILNVIISVLILLIPFDLIFYLLLIIYLIPFYLTYQYMLFNFLKWSRLELKAAVSIIILGTVLIATVCVTQGPLTKQIIPILPSSPIFPILWIIGIILTLIPTIFDPKYFSTNMNYWKGYSIILILFHVILIISYTIFGISIEQYVVGFITLVFFIIMLKRTVDDIKYHKTISGGIPGLIGVFTRPERVTEEEVSLYRDQAVCLVCKGKVRGFSFICQNCKALYCDKCVRTLIKIENMCWSCEEPFDKSKPVKKQETDIVLEGKKDSKGKIK